LPVETGSHWLLLGICTSSATITVYNSIDGVGTTRATSLITKAFKHGDPPPTLAVPVHWTVDVRKTRQQVPGSNDCGPHMVLNLVNALSDLFPPGSLPPASYIGDDIIRKWLVSLLLCSPSDSYLPSPWPWPNRTADSPPVANNTEAL